MSDFSLTVTIYLAIAAIFNSVTISNGVAIEPCGDAVQLIGDLDDCSVYYLCVAGAAIKVDCGKNFSFSSGHGVCVPKDSIYDSCSPSICHGASGLIPHPDSCAMFYDCDSTEQIDETWEPRLRECPHPDLFNAEKRRCEPFSHVNCGARKETKSPCSYYANLCRRAHCIPCSVRFPSCEGSKNGLHPWMGREWSPYYVSCRNERVLFQKQCPRDGGVQVFDPEKKKCVLTDDSNFV